MGRGELCRQTGARESADRFSSNRANQAVEPWKVPGKQPGPTRSSDSSKYRASFAHKNLFSISQKWFDIQWNPMQFAKNPQISCLERKPPFIMYHKHRGEKYEISTLKDPFQHLPLR